PTTNHSDDSANEIASECGASIPTVNSAETPGNNEVLSEFGSSTQNERVILDIVHFTNSRGEEEVGRGSGLERDLFSSFWKEIYESLMTGETERVPGIRHDFQRPHWEAIGRILIKGYMSSKTSKNYRGSSKDLPLDGLLSDSLQATVRVNRMNRGIKIA
ncbi:hypothetical protein AC249_AIPGENE27721, partial [Exaiptasia diaphana]